MGKCKNMEGLEMRGDPIAPEKHQAGPLSVNLQKFHFPHLSQESPSRLSLVVDKSITFSTLNSVVFHSKIGCPSGN